MLVSIAVNLLVIFVPTIRVVFGLAGATCASMLVIILPAVYYIKIAPGPLTSKNKIVVRDFEKFGERN